MVVLLTRCQRVNFILALLSFFISNCQSKQDTIRFVPTQELSKENMYQDYDTLISLIEEINPQIAVREKVTGLNIRQRLNILRSAIDTSSTDEFYDIVRQALALCQDGHANILPDFFFEELQLIRSSIADSISQEAIYNTKRYRAYLDSVADLKKLNLPIQYIDGRYLLTVNFSYGSQFFSRGDELVRCNNQEIHSFVRSLVSQKFLRWDYQHERYYHEDFLSAINLIRDGEVSLVFQSSSDKLTSKNFSLYDSLHITENKDIPSDEKAVFYIDSLNFLYIRVPSMDINDTTFYISKITEYRHHLIDKVAIDIRNNGGGSDWVGEKIVKLLIGQWFYTEITLLSNPSLKVANYLDQDLSIAEIVDLPFIDGEKYWKIYNFYKNVFPDSRSIHYNGAIYIIQDENIFSAAGTLAAYAEYSDQIFSVGKPTGRLLGKGTTPMIFELPNSRLLFRIEPLLDISNALTAKGVYHDSVEIPVATPVNYHNSTDKSSYAVEAIISDPFVQTVLTHKPAVLHTTE